MTDFLSFDFETFPLFPPCHRDACEVQDPPDKLSLEKEETSASELGGSFSVGDFIVVNDEEGEGCEQYVEYGLHWECEFDRS